MMQDRNDMYRGRRVKPVKSFDFAQFHIDTRKRLVREATVQVVFFGVLAWLGRIAFAVGVVLLVTAADFVPGFVVIVGAVGFGAVPNVGYAAALEERRETLQ